LSHEWAHPFGAEGAETVLSMFRPQRYAWTLLCEPNPTGRALLVPARWSIAPLVLADQFAEVVVWESEPRRAGVLGRFFKRLGVPVNVVSAPLDTLLDHNGRYRLVVLEDSYAQLSRTHGSGVARSVSRLLEPGGQCLVVTGNRWGWDNIKRALTFPKRARALADVGGLPSLGGLRRALRDASLAAQRVYGLYPDHRDTEEMLGWNRSLPLHRNRGAARILDRLGLVKWVHHGLAVVAGHDTAGSSFIDGLLRHLRESLALNATPEISDCRFQEIGALLAFVRLPGNREGVLRVALSKLAQVRMERAGDILEALRTRAPELYALAPPQLAAGVFHGRTYTLEAKLPGVTAASLMVNPQATRRILESTLELLASLNQVERRSHHVDQGFVERRLGPWFATMQRYVGGCSDRLEKIYGHLTHAFRGLDLPLVWAHGDLNVDNMLLDPRDLTLTGVIDWDHGTREGLPLHDLLHFLLSVRRLSGDRPIGDVVVSAMEGRLFEPHERAALTRHGTMLGIPESLRTPLLITYWAQHVGEQLDEAAGQLTESWIDNNFRIPLERIGGLVG